MTETTLPLPAFRLLIKHLLASGVGRAPAQEIVHGDRRRLSYRELDERVHRLASGLASLGIAPGNTVGVMEWDSRRYLECFFAVPMMGAVLHTINVRLSPEQVLYTINHAGDDVILVNSEFVPLLAQIWGRCLRAPRARRRCAVSARVGPSLRREGAWTRGARPRLFDWAWRGGSNC